MPGRGTKSGRFARVSYRRGRDDRGGSESIAFLLTFAFLIVIIFAAFQIAFLYNAKNALLAAAQTAANADRAQITGDGVGGGTRLAAQAGVSNVQISETRTATTLTVIASGDSRRIVPLGRLGRISQTVSAPIERVTNP